MLRELMQRTRIARWLADLGVWVLILGAALFVGTWWTEHGTAVVNRVAAWSSPAPDASRPPQSVPLGTRSAPNSSG